MSVGAWSALRWGIARLFPHIIQNQTANNILQADATGVMTARAVSGDVTMVNGLVTIGNDKISSAKIADQSTITFSNAGEIVFKGSLNQRWKVNVSDTQFKVAFSSNAGAAYTTKFAVNSSP